MKKIIILCIMAFVALGCQSQVKSRDGVFSILDAQGHFIGTGFAVGDGVVATAGHVPSGEPSLIINGLVTSDYVISQEYDVALIRVPGLVERHVFPLAEAEVGERVTCVGFIGYEGTGWDIQTSGLVTSIDVKDFVGYNGTAGPGMSGAPVIDSSGAVIGIVSRGIERGTIVLLSPSRGIKALMEIVRQDAP